ncbi:lysozyme inhibitor LprI family protein [Sphingobium sp. H39-3-25]|uniref:lysozyme inhibitor LprI family protein n=1 Tax=Sphingobium arseniciresistens TaxID=3030834 RepID=UPI0023B8F24C|nr:lysozyme inhibitor LprI family protein [Sphingobium arseniciresistens]
MSFISVAMMLQATITGLPQDTSEGCNDKDGTIALSSCYSERADMWEKRLGPAYTTALDHVKGAQRTALKRAQRAWKNYREATCEFYNREPGSIHFIQGAYCMLDLTRSRALELEEYILP